MRFLQAWGLTMIYAYILVFAALCAAHAWYDAPAKSKWYQRLPRAAVAFIFSGVYSLYVLFDGIRAGRAKLIGALELEARTAEIAKKHKLD